MHKTKEGTSEKRNNRDHAMNCDLYEGERIQSHAIYKYEVFFFLKLENYYSKNKK